MIAFIKQGCRSWLLFLFLLLAPAGCGGDPTAVERAGLDPHVARGEQLYRQQCATCHALQPDVVIVGPSLAGIAGRAADRVPGLPARKYIEAAILNPERYPVEGFPPNLMPSNLDKRRSRNDLDALVAYLLTLE
jgi:mono/diheme cytochrome c family protein